MADPAWGPVIPVADSSGHPVANRACGGVARENEVRFCGARIDAFVRCERRLLRTNEADETQYGVAQVRRILHTPDLALLHLVFAPAGDHPLLFSLVRLENLADSPVYLEYSETWDVSDGVYRAGDGACERVTEGEAGECVRALAESSSVIRARAPEPGPRVGLALDLGIALPPRASRNLSFAYVEREQPADLVRAWRGDVARELQHTASNWLEDLDPTADPIGAYRERVAEWVA
ncbi:MAG: hypothetical protein GY725_25280 [bacterium]|nr:hypothetical protein [bacterium]